MRKILTILLSATLLTTVTAQTASVENVRRFSPSGIGYIRDNEVLVGYYAFLLYDKVNSKTNAYKLRIMDTNLNTVKEIDMERPKTERLLEMAYNGDRFCMLFLDAKEKSLTMETYDRQGERSGRADLGEKLKYEMMRVQMAGEDGEVNQSLFPLGKSGFMKHLMVKDDKVGFQLLAFDNDMKPTWKYVGNDPKMLLTADVVAVNDKYVMATVMEQKGMMDKPDYATLLVLDAKTGTKLFDKKLTDPSSNMSALNGFVDEDKNELLVIGEYYDKDDNIISDKSKGLYSMVFDPSGTQKAVVKYDWVSEVSKFVPPNKKGEKEVGLVFFHRVVKGKDGSVYLIGEQFKKSFNPMSMQDAFIKIDDMVVVTLDPALALKEYKVIDKGRSTLAIRGGTYLAPPTLAKYVKVLGGFDYAFTITDKPNDRWFSSYIDYSREKGDDGKKIGSYVGTIVCDKGALTTDKFDANSKATYYSVMPGKAGYLALIEYKKKEKRVDFRLEKVNY